MNKDRKKFNRNKLVDMAVTFFTCVLSIGVFIVIIWLLFHVVSKGITKVNVKFLTTLPDELEAGGGIGDVLFNSFYVLILSLIISVPCGIGAGIFMAEYAPNNKLTDFIRICIEALSSVPSIVFGLFGMALFVDHFHIGFTIIGASITLALLNLPLITSVTESSMRAVSIYLREAAYASGATKFQCIWTIVLPCALSGILTGITLTAGRAFGESAVILLVGGTASSGMLHDFNLFSPGPTLAVHLWYVQSEAIVPDAREIADKSAAVLVVIVLLINLLFKIPIWIRNKKLGG